MLPTRFLTTGMCQVRDNAHNIAACLSVKTATLLSSCPAALLRIAYHVAMDILILYPDCAAAICSCSLLSLRATSHAFPHRCVCST